MASGPPNQPINNGQITVNYRSRINFDTSFNGSDNLLVRFQTGNFLYGRGGSNLTDFNFTAVGEPNRTRIDKLQYRFPVGEDLNVWISGAKITLDDLADPLAPFTNSFTDGAVSFYGSIAPIYLPNDNNGPGLGAAYNFTEDLSLAAFYSAGNGSLTESSNGLFNGQFGVGTQLTYLPEPDTGVGIAYLHQYIPQGQYDQFSVLGFTGLSNTDDPFNGNASTSDNIALLWTWRLAQSFSLEGWGMYTTANAVGGDRNGDTADIWNWKVSFAFPDLFKEGNVGVISVGQPPYAATLTNNNQIPDATPATSNPPWFVETFYLYQVNDNISLTPSVWVGINPANGRDPLWVGAIRTSFKF